MTVNIKITCTVIFTIPTIRQNSTICKSLIWNTHINEKNIYKIHIRLPWWRSGWGVCLPVQGTRVRALVREDPTCRGATGPVSHNYWACASGACAPRQGGGAAIVRGPRTMMKSGPHLPQLERALAQKRGPNTAINK